MARSGRRSNAARPSPTLPGVSTVPLPPPAGLPRHPAVCPRTDRDI